MFRVSFFCDDRKLANALRVLVGIAVGAPEVQPVDTERDNIAKAISSGNRTGKQNEGPPLIPQFAEWLRVNNPTEPLRLRDIKDWLTQIGRNPTNAAHVAKLAVKRKLLQRHGEGRATTYTFVTDPPAIPIAVASKRGVRVIKRRRRS